MAVEHKYFKVRRSAIVAGDWYPIIVPQGEFSRIVVENGNGAVAMAYRSDKDDGGTEKTIPAGLELDIKAETATFNSGDTVGWVTAASGSGPVVVTFTR